MRNDWTNDFEAHPERVLPFPQQAIESMKAGVNHLGYPPGTTVDLSREFLPAGQVVGAITEIVPAGDIVRSMMREATETLERLTSLRAK